MSKLRKIVNEADISKDVEEEVKEALSMLYNLSGEKIKSAEATIKENLLNGKTYDDLYVPITKIITHTTDCRAITTNSSDIINDITKSVGELFNGNEGILNGISGIIDTAITAIVGAGEGQEHEKNIYNVVTEYPAIVRLDFYIWGHNTKAKSIMSQVKSAFACVAFKSAVDISKLDFNTFLALYAPVLKQAFGNDKSKVKQMIAEAKEVYDMFNTKNNIPKPIVDIDKITKEIVSK